MSDSRGAPSALVFDEWTTPMGARCCLIMTEMKTEMNLVRVREHT